MININIKETRIYGNLHKLMLQKAYDRGILKPISIKMGTYEKRMSCISQAPMSHYFIKKNHNFFIPYVS